MAIYILKGKTGQRAAHWNSIRDRVITHEGQLLTGIKGRKYQKKWGKKMLGRDLDNPQIPVERVEQFEKTGK